MRLAASALLVVASWGCGDDAGSGGGMAIGPDGGEVATSDGSVRVVVPAGALDREVDVQVSVSGASGPALPDGTTAISPVVWLTPHGLMFSEDVRVEIGLSTTPSMDDVRLLRVDDEADTSWEDVGGFVLEGDRLSLTVRSFSGYVAVVDEPGTDGGPTDTGMPDAGGGDAAPSDGGPTSGTASIGPGPYAFTGALGHAATSLDADYVFNADGAMDQFTFRVSSTIETFGIGTAMHDEVGSIGDVMMWGSWRNGTTTRVREDIMMDIGGEMLGGTMRRPYALVIPGAPAPGTYDRIIAALQPTRRDSGATLSSLDSASANVVFDPDISRDRIGVTLTVTHEGTTYDLSSPAMSSAVMGTSSILGPDGFHGNFTGQPGQGTVCMTNCALNHYGVFSSGGEYLALFYGFGLSDPLIGLVILAQSP